MSQLLTPFEAMLWRTGQDPALRMTIGNLVILDSMPNLDQLLDRVGSAAALAPRHQWKLDGSFRGRIQPGWIQNANFDAADHVRVLAVPSPGHQRQLLDLLALVDSVPFESLRSPWDITVIDGLDGGRAALYFRADHVLADGIGGTELLKLMLDDTTERQSPDAFSPERSAPWDDSPPEPVEEPGVVVSERRAGRVTVTVVRTVARPVAAGFGAARSIDPVDTVVRGVHRGAGMANSVSRQLVVPGGARSPLTPSGSLATRFETLSVAGARQAALRLGGSRNDLLVTAVAAGLGAYHERQGQPVTDLRLAAPVLVRTKSGLSNSFAPVRVAVPVTAGNVGAHFGVVAERLARARREPAKQLTGPLTTASYLLPSRALLPAIRAQINTIDFIATALRGRRTFGTVCGAAIQASFPFGPRAGRLVNVTALGNGDGLDVGIALDPIAIREPDSLVDCVEMAFSKLIAAAQPGSGG